VKKKEKEIAQIKEEAMRKEDEAREIRKETRIKEKEIRQNKKEEIRQRQIEDQKKIF